MSAPDDVASETVAVVDVHRHSWWKSNDGKRLMIVVGMWHTKTAKGIDETVSYEVLDVGEPTPQCVPAAQFRDAVKRGLLVWVRRPEDTPPPPDLIAGVGSL